MKDLPHHIKKLNRRIIRSMHREEMEDTLPEVPTWPETERQQKKKAKIKMRDETRSRPTSDKTPEQKNRAMKERVPIFDKNNAAPKHAKPTSKKTPRI